MNARPKILVIDDDPDFRASVRALLESRQYDVLEAQGGQEGLDVLVRERPALVVLDIMMKCSCEGYGITWMVKEKEEFAEVRNTPILMTSTIELSPDERFGMCPEADLIRPDYYLPKPLDVPQFLAIVEQATRSAAAV